MGELQKLSIYIRASHFFLKLSQVF